MDLEDLVLAEGEEVKNTTAAGSNILMVGAAGVADLPGDLRKSAKSGDGNVVVARDTP